MRLAIPPPPRLVVPAPATALLPSRDAAAWARAVTDALVAEEIPAFAVAAHRGDWQLALTATMQGEVVAPRYTVLDPKGGARGDVAGAPVPAALWAKGDLASLQHSAAAAAPEILSLLRSVDASLKQSDPNSLYNRPARIYFAGVTGAPGDGNLSLSRDMRTRLPDSGNQVVGTAGAADFTLKGTVRVTDLPSGQQQVEIHWIVSGPQGQLAGDVAQGKDIPKGSLSGYWGDVAVAITDEAADGVREVITNWSGRRGKGAHSGEGNVGEDEAVPRKPPGIL
jgi:hypothetical protein